MMYETPQLETDRLVLKRGTYEDYVKVYEYDFTRLRNIGGEFEYVKLDPQVVKGFETDADETPNMLDFIIYLKDIMEPIGNILYDRYDEDNNSLEVTVNIHPNYWKKGYMTEAMLNTMDYIFKNLDIYNIVYSYGEGNFKSEGLCRKIGFEYYSEDIEHFKRLDRDIITIKNIMSKERFYELYGVKRR